MYEATQGPPLPLDQPPLLNPTGGVKGNRLLGGLEYKKDPSRPGGGVFIAHGDARQGDYEGIPQGSIITSSDEESDGKDVILFHIHTDSHDSIDQIFSVAVGRPWSTSLG